MKLLPTFFLVFFTITALAATSDIYQFKSAEQQAQFDYLTQQFRCLVCQNETLADSNAPLAIDLRQQIADKILQGANNQQITQYLTQRYGDFVLFNPPLKSNTYALWLTPFVLLLGGLLTWIIFVRNRR